MKTNITYSAEYKLVTPLMMAGANCAPEFRLESYARALRFYWRFLALGYYGNEKEAFFWEAVLFGWHEKPFGGGRIRFLLSEKPTDGFPEGWDDAPVAKHAGLNYLSAQGFKFRKACKIKLFKVQFKIRTPTADDFKQHGQPNDFLKLLMKTFDSDWATAKKVLEFAIKLLGLIGGLGARSRRGFGSLMITKFDDEDMAFEEPKLYIDAIRSLMSHPWNDVPRYEVLSKSTLIDICAHGTNSKTLMNEIGVAFQIFRSWGQKKVGHNAAGGHEHKFGDGQSIIGGSAKSGCTDFKPALDDHNNFYRKYNANTNDNRAVFGLPHNYGNNSVGINLGENYPVRRASGLMFHFHQIGQKIYFITIVTPSKFKPDERKLAVKAFGTIREINDPPQDWWTYPAKFRDFLRSPWPIVSDAITGKLLHTYYFADTITIFPNPSANP